MRTRWWTPRLAIAGSLLLAVPAIACGETLADRFGGRLGSLRYSLEAPLQADAPVTPTVGQPEGYPRPPERPVLMVPLYTSLCVLQAADVHATLRAVDNGAEETNPLLRPFVDEPVALALVKAGQTAAIIYISERVWKKNRTSAIVVMIAANVATAFVAHHNYRMANGR